MTQATDWPLISIVVPSYNQAQFLPEALDSIFRQRYPRLEVIVMDGGSTDRSVEIIRSQAHRLKYWQSQKDGGQSAAINAGMRHATGDLVAWLNSDDFYNSDALWIVARAYRAFPGRGLYVGNGLRYDQATGRYTAFNDRHVRLNRRALTFGPDYLLQPSTFFLRQAWQQVGGLREHLSYCMDWDLFLRIARDWPAVTIDDFLGVSREYDDTKTRTGGFGRGVEILKMVQEHSGADVTPGVLLYLTEILGNMSRSLELVEVARQHYEVLGDICEHLGDLFGGGHWTPEHGDPGDRIYLPVATGPEDGPPAEPDLPSVGLAIPVMYGLDSLRATLDSLHAQAYPRLDIQVVDGGSGWSGLEAGHCPAAQWTSLPGTSPVEAINAGWQRSRAEILGWVRPGDRLCAGVLRAVGRTFADNPHLDLIFGNAIFVDADGNPCPVEMGTHRSAFWLGRHSTPDAETNWTVPQSTVFFRRGLLEKLGGLDPSLPYLADFELVNRFARQARIAKLERTLTLVRVRPGGEAIRWNGYLREYYRLNRPTWPRFGSVAFFRRLNQFRIDFLARKFSRLRRGPRRWGLGLMLMLIAGLRLFNPERLFAGRLKSLPLAPPFLLPIPRLRAAPEPTWGKDRRAELRVFFCSPEIPVQPSRSGQEGRDFLLLRNLARFCSVEVYSHANATPRQGQHRWPPAERFHTPAGTAAFSPSLISRRDSRPRLRTWISSRLRQLLLPVLGPRCPLQVTEQFCSLRAFLRPALRKALKRQPPDFLLVSPQTNPLAMTLPMDEVKARLVLVLHQSETVQAEAVARERGGLAGLALSMEAARTRWFERENLGYFDGVVVPCVEERERLISVHGFPAERILVLPRMVDTEWWQPTTATAPTTLAVFPADLRVAENRDAVQTLRQTWPLVTARLPQARLMVLNTQADPGLSGPWPAGMKVLHQVEDPRSVLAAAAAACLPLSAPHPVECLALECLAAGLPVVASPAALHGLEHLSEHCRLAKTPEQLAEALLELLSDPVSARRQGAQARMAVVSTQASTTQEELRSWLLGLRELPRRWQQSRMLAPASVAG